MSPTTREARPPLGIVAGARPRTIAVIIGLVLGAFVLVEALLLGLGVLVTRVLVGTGLHRDELAFERDVAAHRTPLWNQITHYGTLLGATTTVIVLTAIGCVVLAVRGHGPRLPAFLAVAVAGETALFVLASIVVHRMRPPIPHLDGAPPTSSFRRGTRRRRWHCGAGSRWGSRAPTPAIRCGSSAGCSRSRCRSSC